MSLLILATEVSAVPLNISPVFSGSGRSAVLSNKKRAAKDVVEQVREQELRYTIVHALHTAFPFSFPCLRTLPALSYRNVYAFRIRFRSGVIYCTVNGTDNRLSIVAGYMQHKRCIGVVGYESSVRRYYPMCLPCFFLFALSHRHNLCGSVVYCHAHCPGLACTTACIHIKLRLKQ